MIKIENTEVVGWEAAIRGMRNPKNSWNRSDSDCVYCMNFDPSSERDCETCDVYIGPNDLDLMMRLAKGGPVHAKYLRYIVVYVDVIAPLYWWKEFETYRIGVAENPSDIEMNSCSTMHKIHDKEFTLEDFSHEHLLIQGRESLESTINDLNYWRNLYLNGGSIMKSAYSSSIEILPKDKTVWWQMIQLLPSSYNQKRTLKMNYQVLAGLYPMRKNHKLDEWREFCDWIETLPYSEIIIGKPEEKKDLAYLPICHEIMEEARRRVYEELKEKGMDIFKNFWFGADSENKTDWPHLIDYTCSWDVEELGGKRLYAIAPGYSREDLLPGELKLIEETEAFEKKENYACAPNQTESSEVKDMPSMFVEIEETGNLQVVYHKDTKVIYVVCMQSYNRENLPNNFTLLVNPDGTPMLYEGE